MTGRKKKVDSAITKDKVLGHLLTVIEHKLLVAKHCFAIGLYRQGILHDMSKFSPTELLNGFRYFQGDESPNNAERRDKGYSEAWMHHKGRNRHHLEYWNDYTMNYKPGDNPVVPVQMPRRYVAEMLCDRIAASKTYRKEAYTRHDPLNYFLQGKGKLLMHPVSAMELERLLRILDRRGEEECFRFVREYYLKGYPMGFHSHQEDGKRTGLASQASVRRGRISRRFSLNGGKGMGKKNKVSEEKDHDK